MAKLVSAANPHTHIVPLGHLLVEEHGALVRLEGEEKVCPFQLVHVVLHESAEPLHVWLVDQHGLV